jgi:hypothetical protein
MCMGGSGRTATIRVVAPEEPIDPTDPIVGPVTPPPPPPAVEEPIPEEPTTTDPEPETPPEEPAAVDEPVAEEPAVAEEEEDDPVGPEDPTTEPHLEDGEADTVDDTPPDEGSGGSTQPPPPADTDTGVSIDDTSSVMGGRVTTFNLEGDVVSVRILDWPDVGNLTVNPDNTLALVLTGTNYTGPLDFSVEVTRADNTTETITKSVTVEPLLQLSGWATGEHMYMLETDENGELIVEHGDNHRTVHVSGNETALKL